MTPRPICLRLDWQLARRAFSRARAKTGNRIAAKMAIIAITTRSSIKVNAFLMFVALFVAFEVSGLHDVSGNNFV